MKHIHNFMPGFINSVFFKLIVMFLVFLFCINISVAIFFRMLVTESYQVSYHKNILEHLYYVIDELGHNPTIEHGRYMAQKTSFELYYKNESHAWTTSKKSRTIDDLKMTIENSRDSKKHFDHGFNTDSIQRLDRNRRARLLKHYESLLEKATSIREINNLKLKIKELKPIPTIRIGYLKGQILVLYETGEELFLFVRETSFESNALKIVLSLISVITVFILIFYVSIRKILHPVKKLSGGVENIRAGNLDYRIDSPGRDELGKLTIAFNKMAEELKKLLQSKEQLLLDVSHELRSPLTRMKVALACLPDTDMGSSIREDALEMETMITELLENARLSDQNTHLNLEPVPIAEFIRHLINHSSEYIKRVHLTNNSNINTIQCDPKQITVVLRNILNNSLKYSYYDTDPVSINISTSNSMLQISICDTGPGIPDKEIPFIFDPFYRVDKSRSKETGGYGLGLSLCKKIMEAHGGRIEARSKKGHGTTINLYFNISEQ